MIGELENGNGNGNGNGDGMGLRPDFGPTTELEWIRERVPGAADSAPMEAIMFLYMFTALEHDDECTCNYCRLWWATMTTAGDTENTGPFTVEQITETQNDLLNTETTQRLCVSAIYKHMVATGYAVPIDPTKQTTGNRGE